MTPKKLREFLDNIKPHFEKGGKFEKFHTLYDVLDTFHFRPNHVTKDGVHIRDGIDLKRTMFTVVVALIPCVLFGIYNIGHQHFVYGEGTTGFFDNALGKLVYGLWQFIPIFLVVHIVGIGIEVLIASMRGHQVNEGFLVSGMLIPLIMPPDIPLWMVGMSTAFGVLIGKEVFGGTGMNIMNVALLARAFAFFAYPMEMSGDNVWVSGLTDGVTGATAMAQAAISEPVQWSFRELFLGVVPGSIGETSTMLIMFGAALLIFTGVGSWRIMMSVVAGGLTMGLILNFFGWAFEMDTYHFFNIPFYFHLVMGGFAFGCVYMATDPVTSAQTATGKYIYGFLVGFTAILIRVLNPAFPEGIMLSILLFNIFAPLIDHYVVQSNVKRRMARVKQ